MFHSIQSAAVRLLAVSFILISAPCLANGPGLVGLWEIQGTPDGAPAPAFTNLAEHDQDGSMTNIDPWFGTGLGKWEKIKSNTYAVDFTHYFLAGEAVGTVSVQGTLELTGDGDTAEGDFLTTIFVGGQVVDSVTGTIAATRR